MPDFANPFYGNTPEKKLSLTELVRAIRLNIAAEEEAAALYEAHADATDNPLARKVLLDVANEEREHVGEFVELVNILTAGQEMAWMRNGFEEVREMAAEVARGDIQPPGPEEKQEAEEAEQENAGGEGNMPTIGSLKV